MLLQTSGKFGHTFANSGNPHETSHQCFHCLLSYLFFFILIIKIRNQQVRCPNLPDVCLFGA